MHNNTQFKTEKFLETVLGMGYCLVLPISRPIPKREVTHPPRIPFPIFGTPFSTQSPHKS